MIRTLPKTLAGFLVLFGLLVGCDTNDSNGGGGGGPSALEGVWVRTTGSSTETVTLSPGGAAKLDSVAVVGTSTRWTRYEGTWTGSGNTGSVTWNSMSKSTDGGVTWSEKMPINDGSYAVEVNGTSVGIAAVHGVKREYTKGSATAVSPVSEVVAPTFSVPSGTYSTSQSVVVVTATIGGTIRYTTDGTTPTISSDLYSGPIAVSATTTIKAITLKDGKISPAASVSITIDGGSKSGTVNPALLASWVSMGATTFQTYDFSPDGKVYRSVQSSSSYEFYQGTFTATATSISITWLDARKGSDPTALSPVSIPSPTTATYSISGDELSLTIAGKTTVYSLETEGPDDPVELVVDAPSISPDGGAYASSQSVKITAQTGATIYYTTNGSTPTTSSSRYTGAITVATSKTIKAIAELDGVTSEVVSATFTIGGGTPKDPALVGTWEVDDPTSSGGMIFDADGVVSFVMGDELDNGDMTYMKMEGTYSVSGNTLTINLLRQYESDDGVTWGAAVSLGGSPSTAVTYSISGTTLSITSTNSDGSKSVETFTKVSSLF
ncbi:MAG TPA: chitobiase/beta-hexosaminidase C-terminal domain-containing protein [Fibrobacteria bacterium]|nr:chitobiase/beta-hexosaminidase C-terminal domain-containing protein [Fibrobacteria bacterium]